MVEVQQQNAQTKKLLRAKEKAEKLAKKAEEAELKIATKLYEKEMAIYDLECQKAEILGLSAPRKPVGPEDVEQAEKDLQKNKEKFNRMCSFVMDMYRQRQHMNVLLSNVMEEGTY